MTKQDQIDSDWEAYKAMCSEERRKSIKKRPVYRKGRKCVKSKQERWALSQIPGKKEVE
jgi:hypothetical protein